MTDNTINNVLPFGNLSDCELIQLFSNNKWAEILELNNISNYLQNLNKSEILRSLNFKYVTPEEFNDFACRSTDNVEISVFHLNVRSLNSHHRQLCQLLELLQLEFDVIVLTEIWTVNVEFYCNILPGYKFYYELPKDSRVGGVGIYIKDKLVHNELTQYKLPTCPTSKVESVWIEVAKNNKKYIIGGVYRHPNQNITEFKLSIDSILSKISQQKHKCFIVGDFNIDLTNCVTSKDTAAYLDDILLNNFLPTVVMPTRITQNTATLIDHIYYYEGHNNDSCTALVKSGNILSDISDHLPNYIILYKRAATVCNKRPLIRIFSEKNKQKFSSYLQNTDWDKVYQENDAEAAYNSFINIVTEAYEISFRLTKLSRKRSKDKKWITPALKKSSKQKNKLYRKWITGRKHEDEIAYKKYRTVYRTVAAEAESKYYRELFDLKANSMKTIWKNLNTICSYKQKGGNTEINELLQNDRIISDHAEVSAHLNNYFSTVGEKLVDELNKNHQQCNSDFTGYLDTPVKHSIFVAPVNLEEINQLVRQLNRSKSPGPDNIGPGLIKDNVESFNKPLLHIFNLSLSTGIVPSKMKIAKIVPIYKKGDRKHACNYRPISLLSIFDKLLEKVVRNRLYYHLQRNNILYDYQFGFRHNHSTTLALIEVIDSILQNLDNRETVLGIYFDLQKAFDTVNHDILLYKLHNYGVRGVVYDWFKNYLTDRYQYTTVNKTNSPTAKVTCGVPQGSVLGPLLFLVYVNDIASSVPNNKLRIFADDTNLFIAGDNTDSVTQVADIALDALYKWFVANKLSVNLDKTCFMVFPDSKTDDVRLTLNGIQIKKVTSCRYLGVIIDNKLSWAEHIKHVYNKLVRYTSIFYKLRNILPNKVLHDVYFALVHSHLMYAIEIYANTCPSHLDRLCILNNKLLRILQFKPRKSPVIGLYADFNTLPLPELHKQQLLLFTFKVMRQPYTLPSVFKNYFNINSNVHTYATRSRKNIHMNRQSTTYGQRCLKYKGACLWNNLPEYIKNQASFNELKAMLRQHLVNEHC